MGKNRLRKLKKKKKCNSPAHHAGMTRLSYSQWLNCNEKINEDSAEGAEKR